MSLQKNQMIIGAVAVLAVIGVIVFAVPVVTVQVKESYQVQVPYDIQVPYTTTESKQEELGSTSSYTLEAGYYTYWDKYIPIGRDIEFTVSASDTVNLYVLTSNQYSIFQKGTYSNYEKTLQNTANGKLGYHVAASGTYYFVIHNTHSGLFGIGSKNVGIYSASITAYWNEEVTKYRTETRYNLETNYRYVNKQVTLWAKITGGY